MLKGFYFMILVVMNLIFHLREINGKKEREKRKFLCGLINEVK